MPVLTVRVTGLKPGQLVRRTGLARVMTEFAHSCFIHRRCGMDEGFTGLRRIGGSHHREEVAYIQVGVKTD